MKNNSIITEIIVKENKIGVMRVGNVNYISLTDLARYKDKERTDYIIQNWMRTTNSILFLGTWENLHNENFNSIEFDGFKNESGTNAFVMTPKKWITGTNAIGIISKQGRYNSGTYAHHLVILNNLQNTNAELIENNVSQSERLIRLNNSARRQMNSLKNNKNISELKKLQEQINNEQYLL